MNALEEKIEGTIHLLLYILQKLGGRSDIHKLFKIVYFAERNHLVKYGRTMSQNLYHGSDATLLSTSHEIYHSLIQNETMYAKHLSIINTIEIHALKDADLDYLSESEIKSIEDSVSKYRLSLTKSLDLSTDGPAPHTTLGREVDILRIAKEEGASEEMLKYIQDQLFIDRAQFE